MMSWPEHLIRSPLPSCARRVTHSTGLHWPQNGLQKHPEVALAFEHNFQVLLWAVLTPVEASRVGHCPGMTSRLLNE